MTGLLGQTAEKLERVNGTPSPGGEGQVKGELTSLNKILEPFLAAKELREHKEFSA